MTPSRMIHMANQIARFFAAYPREEAIAGVADHIERFWEPRMRQQLRDYLSTTSEGVDPLVLEAQGIGHMHAGRAPAGPGRSSLQG